MTIDPQDLSDETTSVTPSALRAALSILDEFEVGVSSRFCDDPPDWDPADETTLARIIDDESGLSMLAQACRALTASLKEISAHSGSQFDDQTQACIDFAEAALSNVWGSHAQTEG